jgi:hypothetical protein
LNKFLFFIIGLFSWHTISDSKLYDLNNDPIDVVMPCHEKDIPTLNECIDGVRKNVVNVGRVIVVSERKLTDQAEWVPESDYPFNKKSIAVEIFGNTHQAEQCLKNPKNRMGWIFKQITNFYHMRVIPGLSSNVLVIDCDTIFLRPIEFIDKKTLGGLYCPGTENHIPYFEHGKRIIPEFKKIFPQYSGISHHMLFQKTILDDMLNTIEKHGSAECWKVFCRAIDLAHVWGSPSADYELYFNFAFERTNQVKLRSLKWKNTSDINTKKYYQRGFDFYSCHHYMREG